MMKFISVFAIGSGHNSDESNNTIAALWREAKGLKRIIQGVGADASEGLLHNVFGAATGWGMDKRVTDTVDYMVREKPSAVVMTGHSRGAIIIHMIANEMSRHLELKSVPIYMIVLDPVHFSTGHTGYDELRNPQIKSYHSIVMTHSEANCFPLTFPKAASPEINRARHFIPMPGQHGTGTQCVTSAIGKVTKALIQEYMVRNDIEFNTTVPNNLEMCELFAQIYFEGGFRAPNAGMLVRDDNGRAAAHSQNIKDLAWRTTDHRASGIKQQVRNEAQVQQLKRQNSLCRLPHHNTYKDIGFDYFFNQEHAFFFSLQFPQLYQCITNMTRAAADPYFRNHRKLDQELKNFNNSRLLIMTQHENIRLVQEWHNALNMY